MCMGTKTINLMDDAYEMLKRAKIGEESFSDVVRRTFTQKKKEYRKYFGVWGKEFGAEVERRITERRAYDKKNKKILQV